MPRVASFARRRWRLLAALALVPVAAAAWVVWDASRAVDRARTEAASPGTGRVSVAPLERAIPPGIREIGAPSVFRDVARFDGRLFVAGARGLFEYDDRGAIVRRWRTGLELPASGIVALAAGALASSARPELVMATAGDGLIVFDGARLRHVRPELPDHGRLTSVLWLATGRLLLGTEKAGVLVYDGDRTLVPAHDALAGIHVTALAGSDGDVWVGTLDRGALHWRGGTVRRVGEAEGLPDPRVTALAVDGERAYVGTALGVADVRDGQVARLLGEGLFATALTIRGDTLVAGTLDGRLARIPLAPGGSRGARPLEQDAPGTIMRFARAGDALYAVTADAVYVVEEGAGLRRLAGGDPAQLTDGNVSALALDPRGRLWVGYFDRGLDLLDASGARLRHVEDDHVFLVNRIVHDADDGVTAVATANGLSLFDGSGRPRQRLGRADGLIADHVTDVVLRADGMAVATPAGLTLLDSRGGRSLYAFHGLVSNYVYALGAAGATLVAGTLGGLTVLDNDVVRASYTAADSSLPHNWITAIVRVDDGWFAGTYGGGVVRLDREGRPAPFEDLRGPIEINPHAMAVTDAYVFAGTLARGLLVYDRDRRRWTTFDAGLPSMTVTALAAGPDALYVGTDNGIVTVAYGTFAR